VTRWRGRDHPAWEEGVNFGNLPPLPPGYRVLWVESLEHYIAEGPEGWMSAQTCDPYQARRWAIAQAGGPRKLTTLPQARVLATMAREGTLARRLPSVTSIPGHEHWQLRDGAGCAVPYPAHERGPRMQRLTGGEDPIFWWQRLFVPLVEQGWLIPDHPDLDRANRLFSTPEGVRLAFRIDLEGYEGEPIPCLACDLYHDPYESYEHAYAPARKWAKRRKP